MRLAYADAALTLRDNPGQWEAYESTGSCVVQAGPGSGKTRTLTVKLARVLAEDIAEPRGAACVTYNSECARELKSRLDRLGVPESQRLFVGTLHSFSLRHILTPFGHLAPRPLPEPFRVATRLQRDQALQEALDRAGINEPPARWWVGVARHRRTFLDRASDQWRADETSAVVEAYETVLHERQLIDFDDMVLHGVALVEGNSFVRRALAAKFPALMIDEYQDLGLPLHRLVVALLGQGARVFAVGDPDQSIYGFTGAMPELLDELHTSHGVRKVVLQFNYRCAQKIVVGASALLGERAGTYKSKSAATGAIDVYECPGGDDEQAATIFDRIVPELIVDGRRVGDIALLYVNQFDGNVVAAAADARRVPYVRIDSGAPYQKSPVTRFVEECALWCAGGWQSGVPALSSLTQQWLVLTGSTDQRIQRARVRELASFLWAHRDASVSAREWFSNFHDACLHASLIAGREASDEDLDLNAMRASLGQGAPYEGFTIKNLGGQRGDPDHLNLLTLHSAKGLEFDAVIMFGMDEGKVPRWNPSESEIRESRRLFYVGLTRAKSEVHITYSGFTVNQYGRRFSRGRSRFVNEVFSRAKGGPGGRYS
jgi:DNA helicase-2/ATP-dependent DNA helicase PcrA